MSFLKFAERNPDAAQRMMERQGRRLSALKARGICTHGWTQGPPGWGDGHIKCLDCGQEFNCRAEHEQARQTAFNS